MNVEYKSVVEAEIAKPEKADDNYLLIPTIQPKLGQTIPKRTKRTKRHTQQFTGLFLGAAGSLQRLEQIFFPVPPAAAQSSDCRIILNSLTQGRQDATTQGKNKILGLKPESISLRLRGFAPLR